MSVSPKEQLVPFKGTHAELMAIVASVALPDDTDPALKFRKRLSPNFLLSEFVKTEDARSFKNSAMRALFEHRLQLVAETLEVIRAELNVASSVPIPLIITSGWRSQRRNKAVGGSPTSDHPQGYCADFKCPYMNADKLAACCVSARKRGIINFDQLIIYPRHVHISVNPKMRGQVFKAA